MSEITKPEKVNLRPDGIYPSEYVKGYYHGEYDRDEDWQSYHDQEIGEVLDCLESLTKKVRQYADIGGKQFNDDESEFWEMCEENDSAEELLTKHRKERG